MNKYSNDDIYHFTSNKPHRLSDPLVLDRRNSNRSSQQYVGSDLSTLSSAVDDLHIVSEHENTSNFDIVDSLDYDDIDDGLIGKRYSSG
jgi:hypothetical protein